ncbi:unnamed protein product [Miscanthus lutarioriparius]|uniref:Uncharacterized protein n=1 Tax=Miscanthus lutarioriparius TaxID=422564 RepID=A0A811QSS2_9POAL|nr:unnamed protein product [Miscanthus lutarioriparius]
MATGRYSLGSNEALGVNSNYANSGLGKMERPVGNLGAEEKTERGEGSKAIELLTSDGGRKRKRSCFSEEEVLIMTNMTDAFNHVANALRETGPAHVDVDLYHAVMDMPSFTKEALIVAFSHLLDHKAQGTAYVNMVDRHRVLWLRTFLAKNYYM